MRQHVAELKVFVVGRQNDGTLEGSYVRAFRKLGASVRPWDMLKAIDAKVPMGPIGRYVNTFLPVETWVVKANRDLLLDILHASPDIVLVFGSSRVLAGTLGQIKASLPDCSLVLVWPDSLLYCFASTLAALPMYDLVATYSESTVEAFKRLGARNAAWVPLGFDPELHQPRSCSDADAREYSEPDVTFVGNHTPERERIVRRLMADGFRIKVWGPPQWQRFTTDRKTLHDYWQARILLGKDFYLAARYSRVNLNPINAVTYPAANMRLFEIPGCGGVCVSSRSPEMEAQFPDGEACYYYDSEADIGKVIRKVLADPEGSRRVAAAGQRRVLESHTYLHRARQILALLNCHVDGTAGEWMSQGASEEAFGNKN